MYFLIDFENVNYCGLEGTEFLEPQDKIYIFFGKGSDKIPRYRMEQITTSGCELDVYKIKKVEKNGVDSCIITEIGAIFAVDSKAEVAIISNDNGYQSVIDYWAERLGTRDRLRKSKSIATAIVNIPRDTPRKRRVINETEKIDLMKEYKKYLERKEIMEMLECEFGDTEYKHYIPCLVDLLRSGYDLKRLYIEMLKNFGRDTGIIIYRRVRKTEKK